MALEGGAYWLLVEFADDGVGLTPEVRERLFEPFFTTKRGQGGSGLGMHIVYTIVHQMGGQVAVAPCPGTGCRLKPAAGPGAPSLKPVRRPATAPPLRPP
jgi:signal transduction histidine kinase